jgi:hypothetical protein
MRRFVRFHGLRHPTELGSEPIPESLTYLADRKRVAARQNQASDAPCAAYGFRAEIPNAGRQCIASWSTSQSREIDAVIPALDEPLFANNALNAERSYSTIDPMFEGTIITEPAEAKQARVVPNRGAQSGTAQGGPPRPLDAVEAEIAGLAAHIQAATYRLLELIREMDERYGWEGFRTCAHWLHWRIGLDLGAAREKVRVARVLPALPIIADAFRRGTVSYSKVRALTRVATPANEAALLAIAEAGTTSHVEQVVRAYRKTQRAEALDQANRQHAERYLRYHHDDDGMLVISARLPAEQGALVVQALEAAADALREEQHGTQDGGHDVSGETFTTPEQVAPPRAPSVDFGMRRADAIVRMAQVALAADAVDSNGGDRHQLIVHVDAKSLMVGDADPDAQARCELDHGPGLSVETARRLSCDCSVVRILEGGDGQPLDVGRKTRSIPPALRRALRARDKGCRFPGCTAHRFVDAHHIEHWADGGETKLSNTLLLCGFHHRLVHEGGYRVQLDERGEAVFWRPDARPLPQVPPLGNGDDKAFAWPPRDTAAIALPEDAAALALWRGDRFDLDAALSVL